MSAAGCAPEGGGRSAENETIRVVGEWVWAGSHRGAAELLLGLDGAIGVEEEDVHRAAIVAAVVVSVSAHGEVRDPIAVEVAQGGYRAAEAVAVVEVGGEPTLRAADLLLGLDGAIGVEEEDLHRAAIRAAIVVFCSAHGEVQDPIAVEVAQRG